MCIQQSHKQDEQENHNLHETRDPNLPDRNSPGIHKDKLYIENEEDQGIQIIADIELIPGSTRGRDTALICLAFLCVFCAFDKDPGNRNSPCRKSHPGNNKND